MKKSNTTRNFNIVCAGIIAVGLIVFAIGASIR